MGAWWRLRHGLAAGLVSISCAASAQTALELAKAEMYVSSRQLGESSLPVAFIFGPPERYCLPGDSSCKPPVFPPGIAQPAPVVVARTTVGTCPIEVRTGNIALQTWFKRPDRFVRGINTTGFSFPALRPYNADSAYFSAWVDLVAVATDPVRCKAGAVPAGARDLGMLSWGGSVSMATYDGRSVPTTPLLVGPTPGARRLVLQWDATAIGVSIDDCRPPLFETPVFQARATAPAALFPVVTPHVLLSPGGNAAATPCKRINVSAAAPAVGVATTA